MSRRADAAPLADLIASTTFAILISVTQFLLLFFTGWFHHLLEKNNGCCHHNDGKGDAQTYHRISTESHAKDFFTDDQIIVQDDGGGICTARLSIAS